MKSIALTHLDASDPVSTVAPHPSYMHLIGEITEGENEIHTSLKGEIAHKHLTDKSDHAGMESTDHTHKNPT